jgi:hypothetical protein
MKVFLQVKSRELNKEDIILLLQAIRDCEQKNFKYKEITIGVEAPDLSVDEMGEILKAVKPPFTYGPVIFKFKEGQPR